MTGLLSLKRLAALAVIVAIAAFAASSVLLGVRVYRGVKLTQGAKAFSARPSVVKSRVLVVGDAAGAGVGAQEPSGSVAGLVSREFPAAEVRNLSRPGSAAVDVLAQVVSAGGGFDAVIVQAGCEDVLMMRDLDAAGRGYARVLREASGAAPLVILMGAPDVGLAPALFPPVSWVYTRRASRLRDLLILASRETGAEYVDLFGLGRNGPLTAGRGAAFAEDRLHPSAQGHALWHRELMRQTTLRETLLAR